MMIKICGVRTLDEALYSIEHGATALGFNFYPPSPRFLEPAAARAIAEALPVHILKVGVFVRGHWNESSDWEFLDALQLHGYSLEEEIPPIGKRLILAVEDARQFPGREIIVDSSWGRGRTADWTALRSAGRSFILSGGLTVENVAEAVASLRPAGVDVCSGVEAAPGRKDLERVRLFIERAKRTFREVNDEFQLS